ncbi:chemotaxis protein CheW [Pokkaliibacter plantistimulans]|uniref:Chemotaxis protein CheW n=2 Tax=Pseudomonadota TaxID=1224 RepID=A0ABX5M2T7_9GAMM|nr:MULTISPECIES: chemotaxis protein CheW [Pokkaliibacter]MDH2435209.1 chemotaxis protein CheW [Pokkaliibacter sp. MBI-7]PPC79382.1 chemotaxis protein CheW [Pokkaliibacter plantistimulans]PXF33229.1 chemotaxis protein CheW [Pokkaliibacter plantistimulans]
MAKNEAKSQAENNDPLMQWATFNLAEETYAVDVMQVKEVLTYSFTEIAPVPGSAYFIQGILNLRGNVITVVDTRVLFGLPNTESTSNTRIVVMEFQDQVVGMVVDAVAEVIYLRQSQIERTPNVGTEESAKFIQGVSYHNDELIILLDLNRIIEENEHAKERIAEHAAEDF